MHRFLPTFLLLLMTSAIVTGSVKVQRIGIEQGLSQSTVMTIYQDREGFLWFGTWDGLNRYDGYSFLQYRHDPGDSTSLSHNSIRSLFEDSRGNFWVGTAIGGLNRLDRRTNRFIRYHSSDQSRKILLTGGVYRIFEDSAGRIWVQTTFGLEQYDTLCRFVKRIDVRKHPPQTFTKEMCRGGILYIWDGRFVGTSADGTVMTMLIEPLDTAHSHFRKNPDIHSYYEDRSGTSWVSSYGDGLFEYDWSTHSLKHRFRQSDAPGGLSSSFTRSVKETSDGSLWISTDAGVNIGRRGPDGRITGFERLSFDPKDPSSLSSDQVNLVYEDRSGVLWIGTQVGANKILPERKRFMSVPRSGRAAELIRGSFAVAMFEESDSVIWIGSLTGITQYDPRRDTWKSMDAIPGLSDPAIHVIHQDKAGRIWIGTRYGLNRYDAARKRFIPYLFDRKYSNQAYLNRYYAIEEDDEGILWLGTSNGIVRFDPSNGSQQRIFVDTIASGKGNTNILSLLADADTIWVGANGQGVVKMNRRTFAFTRYQPDQRIPGTLSNNQPMSLLKDNRGTIWVATLGGGLNRMIRNGDSVTFRHYSIPEGLLNSSVYGILEGTPGTLWVSTNYGIARFDTEREKFTLFTKADGLPTNEYNQNSYHRGRSGMLYFGGVMGIVRFRPEEIGINTIPPPVAVTDFRIFNESRKDLLRTSAIELSHSQNFFSLEFAALCFEVPQNNRYAYKLEGLEEEWNDAGTRRFANYTDVDPGEYTFRVKGTNNDGVWNEAGASLRIIIVPPFYATLWFRVLGVMAVLGSIIASVRISAHRKYQRRIAELEQQRRILDDRQRTRDKIARDLHDDLASTVGSAGLFIETAKRTLGGNAEQTKEYLEKTSSILNEAEEAMSDIVWSVSPKHDTIQSLATRVRLVTTDLCRAHGIAHTVEVTGIIEVPLSDDCRRGLYLIFKEALNNCIKHSRASAVDVKIGSENGILLLAVKDNGIGLRPDGPIEKLGGNGIANIRKRAEEIGAHCSIVSEPGHGTTIEIRKEMTQLGH